MKKRVLGLFLVFVMLCSLLLTVVGCSKKE